MWRKVIFILFVIEGTRQLSITELAVPPALEIGENAELQCRYELADGEDDRSVLVKWWFTPLEKDKPKLLYQRIGNNKPSVLKDRLLEIKGQDTIELVQLAADDSGQYECAVEIDGGAELRKSEQLIVHSKGTGPNLTISTVEDGPDEDEDEDVVIFCAASDVAPRPKLSILINEVELNDTDLDLDINSTKPGIYSMTINKTVSLSEVDGYDVTCRLSFDNISNVYEDQETYDPSGRLTTTELSADDDFSTTTEPNEAAAASSLEVTSALLTVAFVTQLFIFV